MRRLSYAVIIALLLGSSVLNVLLASRLRRVALARASHLENGELKVGTTVPPLRVKRLDGQMQTITYNDSALPTVLYVFTPQCVWCFRNLDNFKTLVNVKGDEDRFIGLSLSTDRLAEYVTAHKLTIPVVTSLSSEAIKAYKLGPTPQTLVISSEARIVRNWRGAWTDTQKADIEGFFHVTLPGLLPAPTPSPPSR